MKPWRWTFEVSVDVPPELVLENHLDEEHGVPVHGKGVGFSRVLERSGDACLVEVGTKVLGLTLSQFVWCHFEPPNRVVFHSRSLGGTIDLTADSRVIPEGKGTVFR